MKVGGFVLDDLQGLHISQGDPMLMASFRCDSVNLKPHVWLFSGPRNQQIHLFLLLDHWNVGMPFLYLVCMLFHFVGDTKSLALRFSDAILEPQRCRSRSRMILGSSQLGHCKQHDDTSEPVTGCPGMPVMSQVANFDP